MELLELKKKEFEEIRLKFTHDLEEKKLKITQLNIEKRENYLHVCIVIFIFIFMNF